MQEEPEPGSLHSAQDLQVVETNPLSIKSDRIWIKWKAASMSSLCKQFSNNYDQTQEALVKGGADKKLQVMTTIPVNFTAGQFKGEEKKNSRTTYLKNQRAVRIQAGYEVPIHEGRKWGIHWPDPRSQGGCLPSKGKLYSRTKWHFVQCV